MLNPRINESRLLEVLRIMADYVVDVGIDQLGCEDVTVGGHMAVEEEAIAELVAVERTVFIEVDDVRIVKYFGKLVEKLYRL